MVDLNEILAGCINFLSLWFLLLATWLVAVGPPIFFAMLWIDSDFRNKSKRRVLAAYSAGRAFIERHDRGE